MFTNVGNEIKRRLSFVVFRKTLPYFLAGVVVCCLLGTYDTSMIGGGIAVTIILTLIGYLNAREKVILLYAYGELVECVSEIRDELVNRPVHNPIKTQKVSEAPASSGAVMRPGRASWQCTCGHVNDGAALYCSKCSNVR